MYHVEGGIDPGDHPFRPRVVGFVNMWRDLWSWDGTVSSPGDGGTTNPSQSSYHPAGLRFPHRAGRYRPEGPPFSSPVGWSCTSIETFLIRGSDVTLLECRWFHEPHPNSISTSEGGVSTPCGAIPTQETAVFVTGPSCVVVVWMYGWIYNS